MCVFSQEKLGVDEKTLRDLNPKLIYAQITGYGLEDSRAGYDAVIQAESGFQYMNGPPGGACKCKYNARLLSCGGLSDC